MFALMLAAGLMMGAACGEKAPVEEQQKPEEAPKEYVVLMPETLSFGQKGGDLSFTLTSNADWTATAPDWATVSPDGGVADKSTKRITVTAQANRDEAREGEVVITLKGGSTGKVKISQESGKLKLDGAKFLVCANSMVYYGGFVQKGSAGSPDPGMFYKMLKNGGYNCTVIDCTEGGHYLSDFVSTCKTCSAGDHLAGQNFASFDYVILSEAGTNTSTFLSDCRTIYKKVTDVNPNAKKIYINHVYSVYKSHTTILGNLKTLHEQDDVTIINCGQLAYDIYTGKVKVPGGSMVYSDRYTFTNHKDSDTYHPNPLMGYIMTQMVYCALTGEPAEGTDYMSLVKSCYYAAGSTSFDNYYSTYYTTPAAHPFMDVLNNADEMKGIQQLIPQYINKY